MFGMGVGEIAIVLVIALIFIGPKKLPQLARNLGKGLREFQNAASGLKTAIERPDEIIEQEETNSIAEEADPEGHAEDHDDTEFSDPHGQNEIKKY
jgi:sec-independent protein translocase protein TatA